PRPAPVLRLAATAPDRGRGRPLPVPPATGAERALGDQIAIFDKDPMEGRPLYGDLVPRRRVGAGQILACAAGDGCGAGFGDRHGNFDKDPRPGPWTTTRWRGAGSGPGRALPAPPARVRSGRLGTKTQISTKTLWT